MSVKAQALVWDFECPAKVNGLDFKPNHKYVLLKYADHADHEGRNIYPSVNTVAKKTGYKVRNVQYLTHQLQAMGLLIPDGEGPRGTNRWRIPFDKGGAKIAPLQTLQGAKKKKSLGAKNRKSLGANFAPEFKPEPILDILENNLCFYDWWKGLKAKISGATLNLENQIVIISGLGGEAAILQARYTSTINRALQINPDLKQIIFAE